ncbi:hypothetical protein AAHE18_09G012300 [Arachis hypogaea]
MTYEALGWTANHVWINVRTRPRVAASKAMMVQGEQKKVLEASPIQDSIVILPLLDSKCEWIWSLMWANNGVSGTRMLSILLNRSATSLSLASSLIIMSAILSSLTSSGWSMRELMKTKNELISKLL